MLASLPLTRNFPCLAANSIDSILKMNNTPNGQQQKKLSNFELIKKYVKLLDLLNLKTDFDEASTKEIIVSGVEFKSGNAWGLIFAILIASIGLQVNSTAVIIGAMLISPLMGPIIGAGYALGTHDFELLKKSAKNLYYAVLISITTSFLFFLLSPSMGPQSELLARTQPTYFDVLIAFFGGAAGIVALSRKQKGNAIPGVAIATALMPPLCTAGFGLANMRLDFFLGALYLFIINSVFIFIATYIFVQFMGFAIVSDKDPKRDKQIHRWMGWAALIAVIPSLVMAFYLQKRTHFENQAKSFLEKEFVFSSTLIAEKKMDFDFQKPKILIKTIGTELSPEQLKALKEKLKFYDLEHAQIEVTSVDSENIKIEDLEQKFISRTEFFKVIEEKTKPKTLVDAQKISELNQLTSSQFKNLSRFNVFDKQEVLFISVIWKQKPNKKTLEDFETIVKKNISDYPISFEHLSAF